MAEPSCCKPASTSPTRCTRSARRPRSARTWKSPRACAAFTTPNVYFWPGTARSAASSQVICRNTPLFGPPLYAWPGRVEKARPESKTRGHALSITHGVPEILQRFLVRLVHLDVRQHGEVVARAQAVQVGFQVALQRVACALLQGFRIFGIGEELESPELQTAASSSGSLPLFSYSEVSARVATLLASTSG